MEMIKLQSNSISGYQPQPTLPFDIHGTVLSKEGKQIVVGAEIEGKKVEFDLRLNEEIVEEVGEEVYIQKEKVVSHNVRKEAFGLEGAGEEGGGARDVRRILEELGLSHTVDNVKLMEWMMTSGMELSKNTVDSFVMSEKYLERLQKDLSVELIAKMTLRGLDIEHMSLQELSESVSELKGETEQKSIAEWLGFKRDLNYSEAEQVAEQLYGRKMGKDVYDAIIQLQHFNGDLTKRNVNHIVDLFSKIKALKEISVETLVSIESTDANYTIHSLYRVQQSMANSMLMKNRQSDSFGFFTTASDDERAGIERLMQLAGVEKNSFTLSVFRELSVQGLKANRENFEKVLKMKEFTEEVLPQLTPKTIARLETEGWDVGNTSIEELHQLLSEPVSETEENKTPFPAKDEWKSSDLSSKQIGIRELISLIRSDSDMTLDELKDHLESLETPRIKDPIALRTISVTRSLQLIGEHLSTEVISRAHQKEEIISLKSLEEATIEQSKNSEVLVRPIPDSAQLLIREEYMRIRSSLTISMISRSIRENFDLEHRSLSEVDSFVAEGRKVYEEATEIRNRLDMSIGHSKFLIPTVLKNSLDMNLREMMDLTRFFYNPEMYSPISETAGVNHPGSKKEELRILEKQLADKILSGEPFLQEYRSLIEAQAQFSGNDSQHSERKDSPEQFKLATVRKLSRGTVVMQFPIRSGGKEHPLNVLIPRSQYGTSKKEMNFLLSLNTDQLGTVNMALEVSGKNVYLKLDDESPLLRERLSILSKSLSDKGYQLIMENHNEKTDL